jgi:ssDNA-binding Zn-finger/Zn-ribbon topoisomerase 1
MNVLKVGGKGENLWVHTGKEKTFIQCLNCGHIHIIERKIPISVSVVRCECPKCEYLKGLNCGNKEEDVYVFYDPGLDGRYYNY